VFEILIAAFCLVSGGILGLIWGVYIANTGATRSGKIFWDKREYRVYPMPPKGSAGGDKGEDGLVRKIRAEINSGSFDAEIGRAINRNEARRRPGKIIG
jgi:hypothetical protein